MALTDRTTKRLEVALASRAAAQEIAAEIASLGSVAAGVYPSTAGHAFTLGSADTDTGIIKGSLQFSAPTGIAAAGNSQGTATTLSSYINNITTVASSTGVKFPSNAAGLEMVVVNSGANALSVYPATGGTINGGSANAAVTVAVGASALFRCIATNTWVASSLGSPIDGIAPGYRIARGQHQQAAAADTVVTGLATVVAAVASFESAPTINQLFVTATIGNQAGAPAAGSIIIKAFTATATGNVTPVASSTFSDNIKYNWLAIGT